MKLRFFIPLCFVVSALGCKKIESPPLKISIYDIDPFVNTFFFEKNSWWLYSDSLSGLKDSIYVINTRLDSAYLDYLYIGKGHDYDALIIRSKTLNFNSTPYNFLQSYYLFGKSVRIGNGTFPFLAEGQPIFWVMNDNQCYHINGLCCLKRLGFYPQMDVMNHTYYNVYHFIIFEAAQIKKVFKYDTELFFSPQVGIIKKIVHDPTNGEKVWLLKDYEVYQ